MIVFFSILYISNAFCVIVIVSKKHVDMKPVILIL